MRTPKLNDPCWGRASHLGISRTLVSFILNPSKQLKEAHGVVATLHRMHTSEHKLHSMLGLHSILGFLSRGKRPSVV